MSATLIVSKRFLYLVKNLSHFWDRWKNKSSSDKSTYFQVGDVVLISDEGTKRNDWKIAKVVRLLSGNDGMVRGASVLKLSSRGRTDYLNRPINKLYPLEVREEKDERKDERCGVDKEDLDAMEDSIGNVRPSRAAALDARWLTRSMLESG